MINKLRELGDKLGELEPTGKNGRKKGAKFVMLIMLMSNQIS
jgi:hypothetical protein